MIQKSTVIPPSLMVLFYIENHHLDFRIPVLVSASCQCVGDQEVQLGPGAFLPPINTSSLLIQVSLKIQLLAKSSGKIYVWRSHFLGQNQIRSVFQHCVTLPQGCASVHLLPGLLNQLGNLEELLVRDVAEVPWLYCTNIMYQ